ncbi:MAG: aminoacyl-tRNA hydrolase [Clostridia bacterium]|nr:aminoacyl-tRNA hydrolase [Oscillospiraceae bacterium]MBQ6797197.1 aminoacyl-tRNA hydrolase [Clostridia bacterium]
MENMLFGKKSSPIDFIIVGLGNPGPKYADTRHNAGFIALDALADKYGISVDRLKWKALTGDGRIGDSRVLLLKPQTFMNCSGEAVSQAMNFYKIPPERVLVMFDDISLKPGVMRIRRKGSDGGQKGMRSIIEDTDSENFPRIKLGIGDRPRDGYDLADWVLSKFTSEDRKLLDEAVARAVEAVPMIIEGKIDEAMGKFSK